MSLKGRGEPNEGAWGGNQLIDGLPTGQRTAVLNQCVPMNLKVGTVLCEAGEPFQYAYFPVTGRISLMNAISGHQAFETLSIGSMGMLGSTLTLGPRQAPQRGIVQTSCLALRMEAQSLEAALQSHPAFLRILQRYLFVVLTELLQTTACIRFHDVAQRLARQLLLAHDHAGTDHLLLTHQRLADMLGVQRGAVTIAAVKLQQQGIIHYSRGKIAILDRQGLEAKSCECHAASLKNHARLLL